MNRITSEGGLAETDRALRPMRAEPRPLFASVVCVVDRSSTGHAARQQAAALAAGGEVECISNPRPPRASSALLDRCDGADLLVLGAGDDADSVVEHASLPVLLARWCPSGADLTDRILVAVDDESEPRSAAEVAGRLASRYGSTVSVLPAPARNRKLERATAASSRIVLQSTGSVPRVLGDRLAPEQAVSSAAATMNASLLVLPLGSTASARNRAALIARLAGCSVLLIPVPAAVAGPLALARPSGVRVGEGGDRRIGTSRVTGGDRAHRDLGRGLPIDVQLVARPGRDDVALATALRVERELGAWPPPSL